MRCKCCNGLMRETASLTRTVKLETGQEIEVDEDLCKNCRDAAYKQEDSARFYEDWTNDLYIMLGIQVNHEDYY